MTALAIEFTAQPVIPTNGTFLVFIQYIIEYNKTINT
jgi:hypothetical protein